MSCKKSSGRISRHNEGNQIIQRALRSAHVQSTLEPNVHHAVRPDGITLCPWANGLPLVWDFTCVDVLAKSYLYIDDLLTITEGKKAKKYATLKDCSFTAIACDTMGGWGPSSLKVLTAIGEKIRTETHEEKSFSYLMQRLSVCIQRGNATSIKCCQGDCKILPLFTDLY